MRASNPCKHSVFLQRNMRCIYEVRLEWKGFLDPKTKVLPARVVNVLGAANGSCRLFVALDPYDERDHRLCDAIAAGATRVAACC